MTTPDLSVIIVSWNVADSLLRCLAALPAAITPAYRWETIVVDNASGDDTLARLRSEFAGVRIIANAENRLYTAAANQGLAAAQGRHRLLLNPDTLPLPGSLAQLVCFAESHPTAGVLGPRILDGRGTDDLRTGRLYPTPWSETLEWLGVTRRFSHHPWLAANLRPRFDRGQTGPVPVLSGACLLLSESLPSDLRLLDPSYPMYAEDLDLCRRVQAFGLATCLVADAVITHRGGESSRKDAARAALLAVDGAQRYFRCWHGRSAARRHRLGMALVAAVKWSAFSGLGLVGLVSEPSYQRRFHGQLWQWAWSNAGVAPVLPGIEVAYQQSHHGAG